MLVNVLRRQNSSSFLRLAFHTCKERANDSSALRVQGTLSALFIPTVLNNCTDQYTSL